MLSSLGFKDRVFYGWVVVAAFFIVGTILLGIRLSFGVFFKSIESEFALSRAATSTIFSVSLLLTGIFAILAGWALDRYGPRIVILMMGIFSGLGLILTSQTNSLWQLFVTYSLLLSMGTGAVFVVLTSTVSRWFDKKRGLALGIASSGAGLGTVIMAPFATYLIFNFGWRMAYLVMGLIAWSIVIPLSRLMKKDPREIGALPDGVKSRTIEGVENGEQSPGLSLFQAFRARSFWVVVFIWVFYATSIHLVFTHLIPHATDIGISAEGAASILSLIGVSTIVGRVSFGMASDRMGRKLTGVTSILLQTVAMIWFIWARELWMFYGFALVFGFAQGGFAPSMGALIGDTFGLGRIGAIFGVLEVGFGIGAAIGPVLGGYIFDVTHSYTAAFIVGAVVMFAGTVLVALIRRETNISSAGG